MSIDYFRDEHRFLSNFWRAPRDYPMIGVCDTNENFYQAAKTYEGPERERIRIAHPRDAKRLGRTADLVPDWEAHKIGVMRLGLKTKFCPDSDMATRLLATGDEFIREGNLWGDRFWGAQLLEEGPQAGRWVGQNWLGWLLMAQRAALRSGEAQL